MYEQNIISKNKSNIFMARNPASYGIVLICFYKVEYKIALYKNIYYFSLFSIRFGQCEFMFGASDESFSMETWETRALQEHRPLPRHVIISNWENLDNFLSRL